MEMGRWGCAQGFYLLLLLLMLLLLMLVEKNQHWIQINLQKMVLAKRESLGVEEDRIRKVMLGNLFVEGCVSKIIIVSNVVFLP